MDETLTSETTAILTEAGGDRVRVEKDGKGWLVAARGIGSGHTGIDPDTSDDPRDLARRMVAVLSADDGWIGDELVDFEAETGEGARDDNSPSAVGPDLGDTGQISAETEVSRAGEDANAGGMASPEQADSGSSGGEPVRAEPALPEAIDADYAELPALEEPPPEPGPAPTADSVAIFGDNLPMLRILKIGMVAERAAALIDAIKARADEAEGEFADLQAYVVTNLDKATGAFVGTEQGKFDRFVILSDAHAAMAVIGSLRDEKTEAIRGGERPFVEAFDVDEGWPS